MKTINFSKDYLEKLLQRAIAFNDIESYEVDIEMSGIVRDLEITKEDLDNRLIDSLRKYSDDVLNNLVNDIVDLQNELEKLELEYTKESKRPYNQLVYGDDDYTTLDVLSDNISDIKVSIADLEEKRSKISNTEENLSYFDKYLIDTICPTPIYGTADDYGFDWEEDYPDW